MAASDRPLSRRGRSQFTKPPHDVVDLAAHAAKDANLAVGQRRPQLRFLADEGNQLRRPLERDDRAWLRSVRPEQIAVVVVVDDDDRDPALLAHGLLDAGDSVETDLQLILQKRAWC